jgi:hypothetical protein
MTDLIKRLSEYDKGKINDARQKDADRIEELEEDNKELTLQLLATSGQAADALDKLAKAVEVLQWIKDHRGECFIPEPWDEMADAVLAELKEKE